MNDFDRLLSETERAHFAGWDFTYLHGRWRSDPLPWDYAAEARRAFKRTDSVLDMDTGGGERLANLAPLPAVTWATEAYPPNVPVARARLEPLGVRVLDISDDAERLRPVPDASFGLVINRHGYFDAGELFRVLRPGGRFITEQVGDQTNREFHDWLAPEETWAPRPWSLADAKAQLTSAGLIIERAEEAIGATTFLDIGAVVYYLRAIAWEIPGFSVATHRDRLWEMHRHIETQGGLTVTSHHFLVMVKKNG